MGCLKDAISLLACVSSPFLWLPILKPISFAYDNNERINNNWDTWYQSYLWSLFDVVLGKVEDFLDQHAVDSIKSRLESMIGKDEDPVGIDGAVIHFIGEVML